MTKPDKDAAMLRWAEHPDYADALPLSHFEAGWQARAAAGMPARHWNPNRPTEPGWYWLWQPGPGYPQRGKPNAVLVERESRGLRVWVPCMDFNDAVEDAEWDDALWMPLTPPEPPRNAP
jgi:hypothetical protein